ncbi:MAG TPA: glycoside hydrolase family 13 protein [Galbitalea sp.]|jgi:alpha-glucosidase|nr:glycoside hydrolase family 13 protein [Galbitalea sp.]
MELETVVPAPAVRRPAKPAVPKGWWTDAVIYQIYPRSFADGNGDGIGDLVGISHRLGYLRELGVDALWLSPFYVSPQADAGYDVADYRNVDPVFGTLADFDRLLTDAHRAGFRVLIDLVPNHTSSAHEWFVAALAAAPGSAERERYLFREGRGRRGQLPPNNWTSIFGGPAWTRVADGQWYLHLFDSSQPDLNWANPEVGHEFESILRFWLDRGIDGFRVDVAHGLVKVEGLPDTDAEAALLAGGSNTGPMWDQDGVHEIYRHWHSVLAEYGPDRILVAEAWVSPTRRLSRYVRGDEMQQAFNFEFMTSGWDALALRRAIDTALADNGSVDATTTWVLSNHDVVRHTARFGLRDPTSWPKGIGPDDEQPLAELGLRRARAASLMMFALPGSAYVFEGEELGLPEHTTLPADTRQDPAFFRTAGAEIGRDGCRVPLPWSATEPAFGFSATGKSWLPQPPSFAELAVDRQLGTAGSTLELYRSAIVLRRERRLGLGELRWHLVTKEVLHFGNSGVRVVVNFGRHPLPLPHRFSVIVESEPGAVTGNELAPNCSVWLA